MITNNLFYFFKKNIYIFIGSITTASGSAFVKQGHTSVVAGVKSEVGFPPQKENVSQISIFYILEFYI